MRYFFYENENKNYRICLRASLAASLFEGDGGGEGVVGENELNVKLPKGVQDIYDAFLKVKT